MCDPMADISLDVIAEGILLGTRGPLGIPAKMVRAVDLEWRAQSQML